HRSGHRPPRGRRTGNGPGTNAVWTRRGHSWQAIWAGQVPPERRRDRRRQNEMSTPVEKLREYGYELVQPKPPVASYVPVVRTGNILYVSGQISSDDNGVVEGKLGDTMNVVQG